MKLKNVNFIQKYIDVMVIGICVLIALWVVWKFILSKPYQAEYKQRGQSLAIAPAELPRRQAELAKQLDTRVKSLENPLGDLPKESYPYLEEFKTRLARSHFNREKLASLGGHGLDGSMVQIAEAERMAFHVPKPPAPQDVVPVNSFNVLASPDELTQYFVEELERGLQDKTSVTRQAARLADQTLALVGNPNPRDFNSVSVGAIFDFAKLEELYTASAPSDDVLKIPDNWWWSSLVVTDVILERQTLDEATGQWTDSSRIGLLPGQPDFRTERQDFDRATIEMVMNGIRDYQQDLSNPPFPLLAEYSRPWRSPFSKKKDLSVEELREMMGLKKTIADLQKQIEQLGVRVDRRQRLTPRSSPAMMADPMMGMGGPGGLGGAGGAMPGGGRAAARPTAAPTPGRGGATQQRDPKAEQIANLQDRLDRAQTRYAELTGEEAVTKGARRQNFDPSLFMGMGPMDMMGPGMMFPGGQGFPMSMPRPRPKVARDNAEEIPGNEDPDRLHVWAHDLTIEPGKTYRYRLTVSVLNPLFQRRRLTDEQHQEFFNRLTLESEPSAWTQPVKTRQVPQWFVKSVNPVNQQATVEVWRVFDGMPNFVTFNVVPGDPIGGQTTMQAHDGASRAVNLDVGAVVVDLYKESLGLAGDTGVLLYLDTKTRLLKQRTERDDKDSDELLQLVGERTLRESSLPPAAVVPPGTPLTQTPR